MKITRYACLYVWFDFALRSGKEHRNLRPDMIECIENGNEPSYLKYDESGSKNNQGGLNEHKLKNKSVKVFENPDNPSQCVVKLYKKYMEWRPSSTPNDVFYLHHYRNQHLHAGIKLGLLVTIH